jgi:hypothetical protein
MQRANRGLVEPYRIVGNVGHGAARGRTLGFPTANLESIPVLIPAHGVYAARVVRAPDSPDALGAAVALHIGPNPTFGEDAAKVEAICLGSLAIFMVNAWNWRFWTKFAASNALHPKTPFSANCIATSNAFTLSYRGVEPIGELSVSGS